VYISTSGARTYALANPAGRLYDGKDTSNGQWVTTGTASQDLFSNIVIRIARTHQLQLPELCSTTSFGSGDTATIGFCRTRMARPDQALNAARPTRSWDLSCTTYPRCTRSSRREHLTGKTNADIAMFFTKLFNVKGQSSMRRSWPSPWRRT